MSLTDNMIQAIQLYNRGKDNEAILMLEQLARENPSDFRPLWAIAHLSRDSNRRREAFLQVLKLKPDQHQARERLNTLDRWMQRTKNLAIL
jgi:hypothetical protein